MRISRALIAAVCLSSLLPANRAAAQGDKAALARKAQAIFKANCYKCHGQDGTVEGGLNYMLDLKALVSRKKVIPGEAAKSKLYKRITSDDNPMPPDDEKVRPSKEDIAVLKQWIEAGAPDAETAAPQRTLIAERDLIRWISDDFEKMPEAERRFRRYFSIAHLYNAGLSEDELQTYRHALSKLVNSLSWGKRVVVPQPVDVARTLFRIDLRDYKWTSFFWIIISNKHPYSVYLPDATSTAVYEATDWEPPYVRADWFVHAASRPPLYHILLSMPRTAWELEKELKVNVLANIDAGQVARAGFNGSGISRHNRIIERHESVYGAYWKSYDFASSAGQQNLFAYPMGPGDNPRHFRHDGGEIIFNLPNGLQAYMLVDGKGARIDEGPTKIVSDPKQPDRAVVNGISCMSCHARGVIPKDDQVREHVARNPAGFVEREAAQIRTLYAEKDKLAALFKEDAERFRLAVEKTGARVSNTDPIVALALRYDQEIDPQMAASETCLPCPEFLKRLRQSSELARSLGSLNVDGGTVQRRVFEAEFGQVVRDLRLGNARTITNSIGMRMNYIPAGEFMMGSMDDDPAIRSNEKPYHKVRITKPFYMGIFPVTQEQFQRTLGKNPSWFQAPRVGAPDLPVESITWEEAMAFCETLTSLDQEKQAGRRYRLPTEAEWEYACRSNTTTRFWFGDSISPQYANYNERRWNRPNRLGDFPPNRFGLYDMHGNVWQLCADWYFGPYYLHSPLHDPENTTMMDKDNVRVMRGGSFLDASFWARSAARSGAKPRDRQRQIGFRVVCVPETWAADD
jgi:formylglycine-generating enzyme required for sulfatase activity